MGRWRGGLASCAVTSPRACKTRGQGVRRKDSWEAARRGRCRNQSRCYNHLLQSRAPAGSRLCATRAHGIQEAKYLALALLQFPNPAQMHLGIYEVLEASSKPQGLFLGLLFSHLFLFILFHHRGPIVGQKNVAGTIGRARCLQDCSKGRAAIAG